MVIYKRVYGLSDPQIVAIYKDRPQDIRTAYKTAMCLAQYYNCLINIEATRMSMVTWAREQKLVQWFMKRPRATLTDVVRGKTTTIGTPATNAIIEHQTDLIRDYVEDYCHLIWFEDLLKELSTYNPEKRTKYDIVAALGMAMLADEEIRSIVPRQVVEANETFQDIGYYKDENGYTKWGIIPSKNNLSYRAGIRHTVWDGSRDSLRSTPLL